MQPLFSYCKKNSLLHRIPAGLKIVLLFAIPITVSLTPIWVCVAFMGLFFLLALLSKVELKSYARDLRPMAIYCAMILLLDVLSYLIFGENEQVIRKESIYLVLRIICALEVSSVFFRTTSIQAMRDALQSAEKVITFGRSNYVVSTTITLFLGFLPQIFATWAALDLAYRARGGRNNLSKALRLLPLLIAMSIKRASTTYLALLNRS